MGVDLDHEGGSESGGILPDLGFKPDLFAVLSGHAQAEQPPAKLPHEVDDLGRDLLGRTDQVAFVFAVFVIHKDDESSGGYFRDGFRNGAEWRIHSFTVCKESPLSNLVIVRLRGFQDNRSGGPARAH